MSDHKRIVVVVHEWVDKAENDLKNASHTLKLGKDCPTDTVCFHAQQCVEKYLKALLVLHEIDCPKTHDMGVLFRLLPKPLDIAMSPMDQRRLTDYATTARYPGESDPISLSEARQAVRLARNVRSEVRRLLPRATMRRRAL